VTPLQRLSNAVPTAALGTWWTNETAIDYPMTTRQQVVVCEGPRALCCGRRGGSREPSRARKGYRPRVQ
jgi:hypothetical protein